MLSRFKRPGLIEHRALWRGWRGSFGDQSGVDDLCGDVGEFAVEML